jgi:hypothetical protein
MPPAVTGWKLCVLPQDVAIDWSWRLKSVVFSVRREMNFLRNFYRCKSSKLPRRKHTNLQRYPEENTQVFEITQKKTNKSSKLPRRKHTTSLQNYPEENIHVFNITQKNIKILQNYPEENIQQAFKITQKKT